MIDPRLFLMMICVAFLVGCGSDDAKRVERSNDRGAGLDENVLAVIVPSKRAVFTLSSHKAQAMSKALELDGTGRPMSLSLETQSSRELFAALHLEGGTTEDMVILTRGKACTLVVRAESDTGCQGHETRGYRTRKENYTKCQNGSRYDECWESNRAYGRHVTYPSKQACENGGAATSVDEIKANRCD